jgi:AraC family transcriptional regulator
MIPHRLIERPAFDVVGRQTWIGGQDNSLFGRFWQQCQADGLFEQFDRIGGSQPGAHTGGVTLGISRVEADPARREFHYMIAIEAPPHAPAEALAGLERYRVPACLWAAFECRGSVPESIVQAEMYAFMQWLPASGYAHAPAPEMEVYPPGESGEAYVCEFWLPVAWKA